MCTFVIIMYVGRYLGILSRVFSRFLIRKWRKWKTTKKTVILQKKKSTDLYFFMIDMHFVFVAEQEV